jgi:integrase/recombinase XerD
MIMDRRTIRVPGPLAAHAAGLERDLAGQGYRPDSVNELVRLMAHASRWLADQGLDGGDLTSARAEQFLGARREEGRRSRVSAGGMAPLLGYLRRIGAAPLPEPAGAGTPLDALIGRYGCYLAGERGLSPGSLRHYLDAARAFLVNRGITGEADLECLTGADVIEYVRSQSRGCSAQYAKSITTRLRSLLSFLHVEGLTSTALDAAVPSAAGWRLTALPAAVSAAEVARLLDSCDHRRPAGRRDFAVLLILARLGLRAGEVAALRLEDIDWHAGEVTIRGKGNREERLPLPHDVGEAIVGWLELGRPRCACPTVFTRVIAPDRPLSGGGVSAVVRQACKRAGLPPAGAHRLRHFAATEMLRAGGSLAEVGQVLRHRSPAVTSIYAKVDRLALSAVVQPWPGGAE